MTSLVKAPRNAQPAAGNSLCEVQQKFETLGPEVQFTRICQEAAFIHEVTVGRYYRTALDVDDGFGHRTLVCREYTSTRADSDSTIFAAIKQRTIIEPVLQVHAIKCLGMYGSEIQILSTTSSKKTSWVVSCRGQNPLRGRVTSSRATTQSKSEEFLRERAVAKGTESSAAEMNQSCIEETHAQQELVLANSVCFVNETFLVGQRKWIDIPGKNGTRKMLFFNRKLKIGHEIGTPLWSR